MDKELGKRVLLFGKDEKWVNAITKVLIDAQIPAEMECKDFNKCYEMAKEEAYPVAIICVADLANPLKQIADFRSTFPKTNLLYVLDEFDPDFDALSSPLDKRLFRIGRKRDVCITDIVPQIQTFLKESGSGAIQIVLDDKVYSILKKFTVTDSGASKYHGEKLPLDLLKGELQQIIKEMFLGHSPDSLIAKKIRIEPFGGDGHSGSGLFKVTPITLLDAAKSKSAVLKFGAILEIQRESINYDRFVEWFLTVEQTVRKIAYSEKNHTAGILYSYPADIYETCRHFAEYIRDEPVDKCISLIHNMFNTDNKHWLSVDGNKFVSLDDTRFQSYYVKLVLGCNLYEFSDRHFRSLRSEISNYQKKHGTVWDRKNTKITFNELSLSIPDPIAFLNEPNIEPLKFSVVHGDLHGYNILIDDNDKYYFIDFHHTGFGHIYRDFIELELSVRYDLFCSGRVPADRRLIAQEKNRINYSGLKKLIALENAIILKTVRGHEPKNEALLEDSDRFDPDIYKAYKLICEIRRYAELNWEKDMLDYYMGFIPCALRGLKYPYYLDIKIYRLIIAGLHLSAIRSLKPNGDK